MLLERQHYGCCNNKCLKKFMSFITVNRNATWISYWAITFDAFSKIALCFKKQNKVSDIVYIKGKEKCMNAQSKSTCMPMQFNFTRHAIFLLMCSRLSGSMITGMNESFHILKLFLLNFK